MINAEAESRNVLLLERALYMGAPNAIRAALVPFRNRQRLRCTVPAGTPTKPELPRGWRATRYPAHEGYRYLWLFRANR